MVPAQPPPILDLLYIDGVRRAAAFVGPRPPAAYPRALQDARRGGSAAEGTTKSTGRIRRTRRQGRPAHPAMSPEQRLAHAEEIIEQGRKYLPLLEEYR